MNFTRIAMQIAAALIVSAAICCGRWLVPAAWIRRVLPTLAVVAGFCISLYLLIGAPPRLWPATAPASLLYFAPAALVIVTLLPATAWVQSSSCFCISFVLQLVMLSNRLGDPDGRGPLLAAAFLIALFCSAATYAEALQIRRQRSKSALSYLLVVGIAASAVLGMSRAYSYGEVAAGLSLTLLPLILPTKLSRGLDLVRVPTIFVSLTGCLMICGYAFADVTPLELLLLGTGLVGSAVLDLLLPAMRCRLLRTLVPFTFALALGAGAAGLALPVFLDELNSLNSAGE